MSPGRPSRGRTRRPRTAGPAARTVRAHPVASYVVLAYLLSWAAWLPPLLQDSVVRASVGWPTHLPGLLGPALAAVVVTALVDGRGGLRDLGRRAVRWRVGRGWWLVVVATLALAVLALVPPLVGGDDPPTPGDFTRYTGVGDLTPVGVVLLVLLVNGFGEETGWRGFAVERLLPDHGLRWTALVVGLIWMGWHLPLFWILADFRGFGFLVVGWAVGLMAGSVVLTYLYRGSGHSILLVAAWHTAYNFTTATEATGALVGTVTSMLVILAAVWVLRRGERDRRP